jgi:hypothetical protein
VIRRGVEGSILYQPGCERWKKETHGQYSASRHFKERKSRAEDLSGS